MNETIMSGPNEVSLVRKVGSFIISLLVACYNIILVFLTCWQAMTAGKEAVKMARWLGRRSSSNTLRTVALGSNKSG
jgi:hypothetical protein